MNLQIKQALSEYLLALADDELILGHRDSEWCGHAPIIEEDIAFANIALDEIGHAVRWYETIAGLLDKDVRTFPDQMAYQRAASEYRCAQIVELPVGDWAFTILRQYVMDSLELARLDLLSEFSYPPISQAAASLRKEEVYHIRHSRAWLERLSKGTSESRRRMQAALIGLWPYTSQLIAPLPNEDELVSAGYIPSSELAIRSWQESVVAQIESVGLVIPDEPQNPVSNRHDHSPHLDLLLGEMQSLPRLDPEASW